MVELDSCDPTLATKTKSVARGGGTPFVVSVTKSKCKSPFDSDRIRDLRSGQAFDSLRSLRMTVPYWVWILVTLLLTKATVHFLPF